MPTPVRVVERKARRLVVASRPDWALLGCGVASGAAAVGLLSWASGHGLWDLPLADASSLLLLVFVLGYLGLYALLLPWGTEQLLAFDKATDALTVTTRRLLGPQLDHYKLRDVIKVHHNRVDDGTFDQHTVLLIFRGGGAIQFPQGIGLADDAAEMAKTITAFLGVHRSDAMPRQVGPKPRRARIAGVAWEPQTEKITNF